MNTKLNAKRISSNFLFLGGKTLQARSRTQIIIYKGEEGGASDEYVDILLLPASIEFNFLRDAIQQIERDATNSTFTIL